MVTSSSVTHVVLVRWTQEPGPAELEELTVSAQAFVDVIPGVVAVQTGPSTSPEGLEGGFEWALVVRFASGAARDAYLPHPAHQPVAALISRLADQVVVFDVKG